MNDNGRIRACAVEIAEFLKGTYKRDIQKAFFCATHIEKINNFPVPESIIMTAETAKLTYDCIMTAVAKGSGREQMVDFVKRLSQGEASDTLINLVNNLYNKSGSPSHSPNFSHASQFNERHFHHLLVQEVKEYYLRNSYAMCIFEAIKLFESRVKEKSKLLSRDGADLMRNAFGEKGVLHITMGQTQTDKNIENGIREMSAGVMLSFRNQMAHTLASQVDYSKKECLDILSTINMLMGYLEKSVYFR